jgi:hypothetical protein
MALRAAFVDRGRNLQGILPGPFQGRVKFGGRITDEPSSKEGSQATEVPAPKREPIERRAGTPGLAELFAGGLAVIS